MAELLKVREITIDTMQHKDLATKEEELKVMRFYQNDLNSAKLLINVTHDKVVTDFSTATKVQIAFLKPDGKRVFQDVQNVNQMQGKYYVVLSTQTLIAYGNVVAQLRLTFPDNKVIETCKFVFAVDESIMSDEAMKSTNEFPVIQKAIEAGTKLEKVDIDGIIAAGAKADAALPKAGGTMTGDLVMATDKNIVLSSDDYLLKIRGQKGNSKIVAQVFKPDGTSTFIGEYRGDNNKLTINCDTNLLKNTGDTMSGNLVMSNALAEINFKDAKSEVAIQKTSSGNLAMWDRAGQQTAWIYDTSKKEFRIEANTNLLKTSGGTMTGELMLNSQASIRQAMPKTASARGFRYQDETSNAYVAGLGFYRSSDVDKGACYMGWSETPWSQANSLSVGENVFKYKGKDIAFADKNGRATITVTADAELAGANGVIADRRGNTVTVRAAIRRKAGVGHAAVMFTMPDNMRPLLTVQQTMVSTDGSVGVFTIDSSGNVTIVNPTATDVSGKNFYATMTYVVD